MSIRRHFTFYSSLKVLNTHITLNIFKVKNFLDKQILFPSVYFLKNELKFKSVKYRSVRQ